MANMTPRQERQNALQNQKNDAMEFFRQQVQANASRIGDWDKARRRQFVERIARSKKDDEFAGSNLAAMFVQGQIDTDGEGGVTTNRPQSRQVSSSRMATREQTPDRTVAPVNLGALDSTSMPGIDLGGAQGERSQFLGSFGDDMARANEIFERQLDFIDQQADVLEMSRDNKIQRIQQAFNELRRRQAEQNKASLGATRGVVGRSGSFASVSNQGILKREIQRGEDAIAQLIAEEDQAIAAAMNDWESGNLELARDRLNLADQQRQQITQMRTQQLQNLVNYENLLAARSDREQTEFERNLSKLDLLGQFSPENLTEGTLDTFDAYLGMGSGFAESWVRAQAQAREAELASRELQYFDDVTQILARVPENETINIGGENYTGFKEVDENIMSSWQTDNLGNVSLLTYNMDTGAYDIIPFGAAGRGAGGAGARTTRITGDGNRITGETSESLNNRINNLIKLDSATLSQDEREETVNYIASMPRPGSPAYAAWASSVSEQGINPIALYYKGQQLITEARTGGEQMRAMGKTTFTRPPTQKEIKQGIDEDVKVERNIQEIFTPQELSYAQQRVDVAETIPTVLRQGGGMTVEPYLLRNRVAANFTDDQGQVAEQTQQAIDEVIRDFYGY